MRYNELILEGPAEDVSKHRRASQATYQFMEYAGARSHADLELHFRDGMYYGYDARNFDSEGRLGADNLVILVGPRRGRSDVEASYCKLKGIGTELVGGKYARAIFMYCSPSKDWEVIKKSISSVKFMQVMKHEMVHLLDDLDTGKVLSTHKYSDNPNMKDYYNNPWEFNAYYHMISDSLTSMLSEFNASNDTESIRDYADLYGITGNFAKDMASLVSSEKNGKSFLKELTTERRKAFLRRLYKLHKTVVDLMNTQELSQVA